MSLCCKRIGAWFVIGAVWSLFAEASAVAQCPDVGSCIEPHSNPGCEDETCCLLVCAIDSICCDEEWDANCVVTANSVCDSICGSSSNNSCFEVSLTPACDNQTCCDAVCVIDPFCCTGRWDQTCVQWASFNAVACAVPGPGCGDADAGECDQVNGTTSCNDADCCELVCANRPECCSVTWDDVCVSIAETLCSSGCAFETSFADSLESESCDGGDTNDACDGGSAEPLQLGVRTLGRFRDGGDLDVYAVDLAPLDLDGDGEVQVRLRVAASDAMFELLSDGCGQPANITRLSSGCAQFEDIVCVPAVETLIVVSPQSEPDDDCEAYVYTIVLEAQDFCGPPCENATPCLVPHAGPGCEDSKCCSLVCDADPACCVWAWDGNCARLAAIECGGPPPENDDCGDAIEVFEGQTPFRQLLSTVDDPEASCDPDASTGDVWFTYRVKCVGDLLVRTCGTTDFDTVIEVYRGGCGTLDPIACNDDYELCVGGQSEVQLSDLACNEDLLIRVSGTFGEIGSGSLEIVCLQDGCLDCEADLNGDLRVDGADFGLLLLDWGPCKKGCAGDLTGDLKVDGADIGLMLLEWGDC